MPYGEGDDFVTTFGDTFHHSRRNVRFEWGMQLSDRSFSALSLHCPLKESYDLLSYSFLKPGSSWFTGAATDVADVEDELLDLVMLRLRLADGLDLASVAARYGNHTAEQVHKSLRKHIERGLVQEAGHVVRLQDPQGFLFSNDIISDVFLALDRV